MSPVIKVRSNIGTGFLSVGRKALKTTLERLLIVFPKGSKFTTMSDAKFRKIEEKVFIKNINILRRGLTKRKNSKKITRRRKK